MDMTKAKVNPLKKNKNATKKNNEKEKWHMNPLAKKTGGKRKNKTRKQTRKGKGKH